MASTDSGIKTIVGGASQPLRQKNDTTSTEVPKFVDILARFGLDTIDSAAGYGDSETVLGDYGVPEKFVVDTKVPGVFGFGSTTREQIVQTGQASLQKLKTKQVNTLYIHFPDPTVPFASTLAGINDLHQAGMFRRFGLSNFTPAQVQEAYDICKENGYILPTLFQGNYNAFARTYEKNLLPLLRSLNISFYAYSPQAGGFLAKTTELVAANAGRFDPSNTMLANMYTALYKKPTLLSGLTKWNEIATEAGIKPGEMAVRWVKYHSALKREYGDGVIIGAGRSLETLEETLKATEKGPLDEKTVKQIDEVWEMVKDEAPVDNYNDFLKDLIQQKEAEK